MRVAFISHLFPTRSFPAKGTFIREQLRNISKHTHALMIVPSVRALPFTQKWRYVHDSFIPDDCARRVKYLSFPGGRFPKQVRRNLTHSLMHELGKFKPDLVHVNWLRPDGFSLPGLKHLGCPLILSIHGSDWYNTYNQPRFQQIAEESLESADLIYTVGDKLRADILNAFPRFSRKIRVSYNPVDFDKFTLPTNRLASLKAVNWHPAANHLLCVANLSHEKGIDILLEAWKIVQYSYHDSCLHLIGNIPDSDYARRIQVNIRNTAGVELHKPVGHDEIVKYYQACDLLVLPSRREGFGLAAAEAIACGKPVVSTRCGGPEDIINPENGILTDPEKPELLADAICEIIAGRPSMKAEEIRNSIRCKFDQSKITAEIIASYQELLSLND